MGALEKELIITNRNNPIKLAEFIASEFPSLVVDDSSYSFYDFQIATRTYLPVVQDQLIKIIYNFFVKYDIGGQWAQMKINNILLALKCSDALKHFNPLKNIVPQLLFQNGVLEFKERGDLYFRGFNLETDFFTVQIPMNFPDQDQKYPTPVFDDFLKTTFTLDDGTVDEEIIDVILQISGYILYPKNVMEKMFIFLGDGANGKSVLLSVFQLFFASENISALSLEELSEKSSLREMLLTSKLNITTESKVSAVDTEEIKKIISGEAITINPKYRNPYKFIPATKLIIASNSKPYFNDSSYGLERRLYPIEFKNRFIDEKEYQKHLDRKNNPNKKRLFLRKDKTELMKQLYEEREGILFKFLSGLKRLKDNNWILPESSNVRETLSAYQETIDSAGTFLKENYRVNNESEGLTLEEILNDYRRWYKDNVSERPLNYSSRLLGQRVQDIFRIKLSTSKKIFKNDRYSTTRFFPLERIGEADLVVQNSLTLEDVLEKNKIPPNDDKIDLTTLL